jgi:hypothetical protein
MDIAISLLSSLSPNAVTARLSCRYASSGIFSIRFISAALLADKLHYSLSRIGLLSSFFFGLSSHVVCYSLCWNFNMCIYFVFNEVCDGMGMGEAVVLR